MRGLAIWGASEYFVWSPSAIGFLINNIVLLSISSDFLVSRHLTKMTINHSLDDSDFERFNVEPALHHGPGVEFFGAPYIIGQCIMPTDLFGRLGLEMANESVAHSGWAEGPVLKLTHKLEQTGQGLGLVPLFNGNRDAHIILMELQLEKATKFLIEDFLRSDFTNITKVEAQKAIEDQAREYLVGYEIHIEDLKRRYEQKSGIRLP
jgi:hypothetical protein